MQTGGTVKQSGLQNLPILQLKSREIFHSQPYPFGMMDVIVLVTACNWPA